MPRITETAERFWVQEMADSSSRRNHREPPRSCRKDHSCSVMLPTKREESRLGKSYDFPRPLEDEEDSVQQRGKNAQIRSTAVKKVSNRAEQVPEQIAWSRNCRDV